MEAIRRYIGKKVSKYVEFDYTPGSAFDISTLYQAKNVQLKKAALYQLNLPITVAESFVGELSVTANLWKMTVNIKLKELLIIATPERFNALSPQELKKEILRNFEGGFKTESSSWSLNYIVSWIAQVTIESIHIRFEDESIQRPGEVMACGILLHELSATHEADRGGHQVKSANLTGFKVYCDVYNSNTSRYLLHNSDRWQTLMRDIMKEEKLHNLNLQFVMPSIEGQLLVESCSRADNSHQKCTLMQTQIDISSSTQMEHSTESVKLFLSREQYLSVRGALDTFQQLAISRMYRPNTTIKASQSDRKVIREWWLYAVNATLNKKIFTFNWDYIKQHRRQFQTYKMFCMDFFRHYDDWSMDKKKKLRKSLMKYEAILDEVNILLARDQAVAELQAKDSKFKLSIDREALDRSDSDLYLSQPSSAADDANQLDRPNEEQWQAKKEDLKSRTGDAAVKIICPKIEVSLFLANKAILRCEMDFPTIEYVAYANDSFSFLYKLTSARVCGIQENLSEIRLLCPAPVPHNKQTTSRQGPKLVRSEDLLELEYCGQPDLTEGVDFSSIKIKLKQLFAFYNKNAITQLIKFIEVSSIDETAVLLEEAMSDYSRDLIERLRQSNRFNITLFVNSPALFIPEYGDWDRCLLEKGNVLVFNMGDVSSSHMGQETSQFSPEIHDTPGYHTYDINISSVKLMFMPCEKDPLQLVQCTKTESILLPDTAVNVSIRAALSDKIKPLHQLQVWTKSFRFRFSEESISGLMTFLTYPDLYPFDQDVENKAREKEDFRPMKRSGDAVDGAAISASNRIIRRKNSRRNDQHVNRMLSIVRKSSRLNSNKSSVHSAIMEEGECTPELRDVDRVDFSMMRDFRQKSVNDPSVDRFDPSGEEKVHQNKRSMKYFARYKNPLMVVVKVKFSTLSFEVQMKVDKTHVQSINLDINTFSFKYGLMIHGWAVMGYIRDMTLVDNRFTDPNTNESLRTLTALPKSNSHFLYVAFRQVSPKCPVFSEASGYDGTENYLEVTIGQLNVVLHRQAILETLETIISMMDMAVSNTRPLAFTAAGSRLYGSFASISSWSDDGITSSSRVFSRPIKFTHKVVSRFEGVHMRLCLNTGNLAAALLSEMTFRVQCTAERHIFHSGLKNLVIEDLNEGALYSQLLTTLDEELIVCRAEVTRPPKQTHSDGVYQMPKIKSKTDITMEFGRSQIIFINVFFQKSLHFVDGIISLGLSRFFTSFGKFAKRHVTPLKEASQLATVSEGHNPNFLSVGVVTPPSSPSLTVEVKLYAPEILLPRSSSSREILAITPGLLTIHSVKMHNQTGFPPIEMKLDSVRVTRVFSIHDANLEKPVVSGPDSESRSQHLRTLHTLVPSVELLKMQIRYHSIKTTSAPLLFIKMNLANEIQVDITSVDISLIRNILAENLSEDWVAPKKTKHEAALIPRLHRRVSLISHDLLRNMELSLSGGDNLTSGSLNDDGSTRNVPKSDEIDGENEEPLHWELDISVSLVKVSLFWEKGRDFSKFSSQNFPELMEKKDVGLLHIRGLQFDYKKTAVESKLFCDLRNFTLEDRRIEKSQYVTTIIKKSDVLSRTPGSMVIYKSTTDKSGFTKTEFTVETLTLNLVAPFCLLALECCGWSLHEDQSEATKSDTTANRFSEKESNEVADRDDVSKCSDHVDAPTIDHITMRQAARRVSIIKHMSQISRASVSSALPSHAQSINHKRSTRLPVVSEMVCRAAGLQIRLFSQPESANSPIVQLFVSGQYTVKETSHNLQGTLNLENIEAESGLYKHDSNKPVLLLPVLAQCGLLVDYRRNKRSEQVTVRAEVMGDSLVFKASNRFILTLKEVSSRLTQAVSNEPPKPPAKLNNLWEKTPINSDKWLREVIPNIPDEGSTLSPCGKCPASFQAMKNSDKTIQSFSTKIGRISLIYFVLHDNVYKPTLSMKTGLDLQVKNWSSRICVSVDSMPISVQFHNTSLAIWEPLIEPVPITTDTAVRRFQPNQNELYEEDEEDKLDRSQLLEEADDSGPEVSTVTEELYRPYRVYFHMYQAEALSLSTDTLKHVRDTSILPNLHKHISKQTKKNQLEAKKSIGLPLDKIISGRVPRLVEKRVRREKVKSFIDAKGRVRKNTTVDNDLMEEEGIGDETESEEEKDQSHMAKMLTCNFQIKDHVNWDVVQPDAAMQRPKRDRCFHSTEDEVDGEWGPSTKLMPSPITTRLGNVKEEDEEEEEEEKEEEKENRKDQVTNVVHLFSTDKLMVNVTPVSLSIISDIIQTLSATPASEENVLMKGVVRLINDTGLSLNITTTDDPNAQFPLKTFLDCDRCTVINGGQEEESGENGEEARPSSRTASLNRSFYVNSRNLDFTTASLNCELSGYRPFCIPFRISRNQIIELKPVDGQLSDTPESKILLSIENLGNSREIRFSSPILFENRLSVTIELVFPKSDREIRDPDSSVTSELMATEEEVLTLTAQEKRALPFKLYEKHADLEGCHIRPAGYGASSSPILPPNVPPLSQKQVSEFSVSGTVTLQCSPLSHSSSLPLYLKTNVSSLRSSYTLGSINLRSRSRSRARSVRDSERSAAMLVSYRLSFDPVLIIHNCLPYDIECYQVIGQESTGQLLANIKKDETAQLLNVNFSPQDDDLKFSVKLPGYQGSNWSGILHMYREDRRCQNSKHSIILHRESPLEEQSPAGDISHTHYSHSSTLIKFRVEQREPALLLHIYAAYWVVNDTGLDIDIKIRPKSSRMQSSGLEYIHCPTENMAPAIFSFKSRYKKKVRFRVANATWSEDKVTLEAVDVPGLLRLKRPIDSSVIQSSEKLKSKKKGSGVACQELQLLLTSRLSPSVHTKIVTLTPKFLVRNSTCNTLVLREIELENRKQLDCSAPQKELQELILDQNEQKTFFPQGSPKEFDKERVSLLLVRTQDESEFSKPFFYSQQHTTVLKMPNGSALVVDVLGGIDEPFVILLEDYDEGDCPVRFQNLCTMSNLKIKIKQKGEMQVEELDPGQQLLYTWQSPIGLQQFEWSVEQSNESYPVIIDEDCKKDYSPFKNASICNFPPDKRIYSASFVDKLQRVFCVFDEEQIAHLATKGSERETCHTVLHLDLNGLLVSLMTSPSSNDLHGRCIEVALFTVSPPATSWSIQSEYLSIEDSCQLEYAFKKKSSEEVELNDKRKVNMQKLRLVGDNSVKVKRVEQPAICMFYAYSDHNVIFLCKLHHIQIDNQLPDAVYPTALYPAAVSHQQEGLYKHSPVPFLEMQYMYRRVPENNINTIHTFHINIQEFFASLDRGFVYTMMNVLAGWFVESTVRSNPEQLYVSNAENIKKILNSRSQRILFRELHVSPIKMRLSFSMEGTVYPSYTGKEKLSPTFIDLLFKSPVKGIGNTKELEICLDGIDQHGSLLSWSDMITFIQNHLIINVKKKIHLIIFGLDVLGNPYQFFMTISRGFSDISNKGCLTGTKSLGNHAISAVANSISRASYSAGAFITSVTLDNQYILERKRRFQMAKTARSCARSAGMSLGYGLMLGVSGIVLNPRDDMRHRGIVGLLPGLGKGVLGIIMKPVGGLCDMTSLLMDALKRAVEEGNQLVFRQRIPRHIHPLLGIRPFSQFLSEGERLLRRIDGGYYGSRDLYWVHAQTGDNSFAILTHRRLIEAEYNYVLQRWEMQRELHLERIINVEIADDTTIDLCYHKRDKKKLREIILVSKEVALIFKEQIETMMKMLTIY